LLKVWWPARHIVKEAIEKRNEVDPSGKIIAPKNETGFDSRKTLPAAWCGLRDDVLSTAINIPNCIFVRILLNLV
jgi:hypothetical protein